jgi:hypothetical protein
MDIYLILILIFLILIIGLIIWILKIVKFYQQRRTKLANINLTILGVLILIISWELRLIPLAPNYDFRNQTKDLTGKQFWCWNDYRYDELGLKSEGFTFEIYNLNEQMADYFSKPNKDFFENYPDKKLEITHWKETPITDTEFVNFMTPTYSGWSISLEYEITLKQKFIRKIASEKGSFYAIRQNHGNDLYIISPKNKKIIYINHNM